MDREPLDSVGANPTDAHSGTMPQSEDHNRKPVEIVRFLPGDPENPRNWRPLKKWSILSIIILIDLTVSWGASGFSPASTRFVKDFGVSTEVGTLGLSLYILGLALGPMTLAPLSEYFGRSAVYILSYGIFLLFLVGSALVQNLAGFLVLRILSGIFSSVTIANIGGTISDLWDFRDTGIPMSCFLWAATFGSPSGYFLFAFLAQNRPWRDVFWALLGICGGFWILMIIFLRETRHSIILIRRVTRERQQKGTDAIDVPDSMKQRGLKELFHIALTRPFRFLLFEAIVIFAALYNGYLYGLSFLFNDAFPLIFGKGGHDFDTIGVGLSFLGIMVGITVGPVTNLLQERWYQQTIANLGGKNVPEARVHLSKVAAVAFPISMFWWAWTTYSTVHYIVPLLASALWGWSFYTLILVFYLFVEDSYKVYSASALAGIGLIRNIAGAGFPLFARQMFLNEGFQWAGTILAFLAVLLIPIPFILAKYGRAIRMRSPWARQHMDDLTGGEQSSTDSSAEKKNECTALGSNIKETV